MSHVAVMGHGAWRTLCVNADLDMRREIQSVLVSEHLLALKSIFSANGPNLSVYLYITACPAGEYHSRYDTTTCQQCPANTDVTEVAAAVCQCLPGYFRNTESHTHPDALQYVEPANEKPGNKCTSKFNHLC